MKIKLSPQTVTPKMSATSIKPAGKEKKEKAGMHHILERGGIFYFKKRFLLTWSELDFTDRSYNFRWAEILPDSRLGCLRLNMKHNLLKSGASYLVLPILFQERLPTKKLSA